MNKVLQIYLKIVKAFVKSEVTITIREMNHCYMFIRITNDEEVLDIDITPNGVKLWNSETAKDCNDEQYIPLEELEAWLETIED